MYLCESLSVRHHITQKPIAIVFVDQIDNYIRRMNRYRLWLDTYNVNSPVNFSEIWWRMEEIRNDKIYLFRLFLFGFRLVVFIGVP